jgi:DNA polymerase III alpha subunit
MPDIDIDFADRDKILKLLTHRAATLDGVKKHNTGVYVTEIPHNPVNNCATIDYKTADQRGYFKLDFLNVSIYKDVKNEQHLVELLNQEPIWELYEHKDFVDQVFHISGHSDILKKLKPKNIGQLAAVLAIIRPAKRYLANSDWDTIEKEVWTKPEDDQYFFKKSHAYSYAAAVIVHTNLLCNEIKNFS